MGGARSFGRCSKQPKPRRRSRIKIQLGIDEMLRNMLGLAMMTTCSEYNGYVFVEKVCIDESMGLN